MNPVNYLRAFIWVTLVGLCCMIFMDYWLPILVGTVTLTLLIAMATPRRN